MTFTVLDDTNTFNAVFDFGKNKTNINYWDGKKRRSIGGRKKKKTIIARKCPLLLSHF